MATYTKKFAGGSTPGKSLAPQTSPDDKRAFDARPKPSNERRRDDGARPTHHIDEAAPDLLDTPPGGED